VRRRTSTKSPGVATVEDTSMSIAVEASAVFALQLWHVLSGEPSSRQVSQPNSLLKIPADVYRLQEVFNGDKRTGQYSL